MKKLIPLVIGAAITSVPVSALAQSMPAWKSYMQTGNISDIVPSAGTSDSVAAWLAKKVDVTRIGAASGIAPLDAMGAVRATAFANFDYTTIDPSTAAGRLLVPVPSMMCPGTMGTTSPSAQCIAVQATTDSPAVVGQMIGVVNEDKSTDTQKFQVIQALGALQDSPNSAVWGQNIVMTQGPGTAGIAGQEIDMNRAANCDTAVDSWDDSSCPGNTGVWVTGLQINNHVGSPAFVVAPSPSATTPLFNVGYMVTGNVIRDTAFLDASTTSTTSLRVYNGHQYGVDCSNATFSGTCLALQDSGTGQDIAWLASSSENAGVAKNSRLFTNNGQFSISNYSTGTVNVNSDISTASTFAIGSTKGAYNSTLGFKSSGGSLIDAAIVSSGGTPGQSNTGKLTVLAGQFNISGLMKMPNMTKAAILGVASPEEGMMAYDSDDHTPVVYGNGAWYPITLGTALSN